MSFTPRTSNSGMTNTTPYNNHYYVGPTTTQYFYNYSNVSNYQCTAYCLGRLGEIAGEPVCSFKNYPSSPKHYAFQNRLDKGTTGFGNANEWYDDTTWSKTTDKTKPKLGAIVCYSKYKGDGGGGHVQIVEKIDGNTIYVSQNQTCYGGSFLTAINVNDLPSSGTNIFMGYIYNPYIDDEPTPTPSGKDVIEFTNNGSYAYITFDGTSSESGYDYKLQLVAPTFALAGTPNTVRDSSMGSDWEFVASINGGFFFALSGSYYADGLEKQHWTWNEQYDDYEFDNVLAIGGDGSNNTKLSSGLQTNMREYGGEWCLTGGISLGGGSSVSSDVDSSTGHSFIGYNGNKIIMGCSKNGVSGASLRSYISGLGYTGVELDGGGSTSFIYNGTQYSNKYDGRSVKNVICLYKRKKTVSYTVSLTAKPSNYGSVSGGGTYSAGSNVTIKATPNSKCRFGGWSDGNTSASRTITVNSNISLTAYFIKTYDVKLSAEPSDGGSVTGAGTYDENTEITIKATPNKHYKFVQWSDGNRYSERKITVNSDISLTAIFKKCGILIQGSMGIDFQIL